MTETRTDQPRPDSELTDVLSQRVERQAGKAKFLSQETARTLIPLVVLLTIAAIYPLISDDLRSLDYIGDFFPTTGSGVIILVFTMMAVGLNVVVGYAGLLDLGYVAFYAAGAYVAGWFASQQFEQVNFHLGSVGIGPTIPGIHLSIWIVLVIAGIFTAAVGIVIGLPTLRLRGDYLAIVTLGFGEIVPQFVRNADSLGGFDLTNGTFGIAPIDSLAIGTFVFREQDNKDDLYYWTAVGLLLFTVFCCIRLRDSRLGRAWVAIREDETAAAAMGVPLMRTKTWSYAIGAFFGGIAGAFFASYRSGAFPADFFFQFSVFLLCMVILGGMGSIWGVVAGALILGYLDREGLATIGSKIQDAGLDFDPTKYQFGIYGVIIVLMMLFRPTGLIPERRHKIEMEEGVHDTPFYDVATEGALTDRNPSDD
jgi:branched-chain amino acid transport system permease protein